MPERAACKRKKPGEDFTITSLHGHGLYHVQIGFSPELNLYEHTDEGTMSTMVTATLGLPGLKPEDVAIDLLHSKLTISGEVVNDEQDRPFRKYTCRELPRGKFTRVLKVPLGMRPEDFKAWMEHGLLTLTFPKDPPKQEPHRIPIKFAQ